MAVEKVKERYVSSATANRATNIVVEQYYEADDLMELVTSKKLPMEGARLRGNSAYFLTSREVEVVGNGNTSKVRGIQARVTLTYTLSTDVIRMYSKDPWDIGAQNVNIQFSSITVPLTTGFTVSGKEIPIVNTAKCPIAAETSEYIKELHFTYCQRAIPGNNRGFPKIAEEPSRNASTYQIAGTTIPAKCGKILPQTARYIAEYNEDETIFREYWEIDTTILIRKRKYGWSLDLLNIGTSAFTDDSDGKVVAIWRYFPWTKDAKTKEPKFGSYQTASNARETYAASCGEVGSDEYAKAFNEFPMEEVTEPFPLDKAGKIDTGAMETGNYLTLEVCDCDTMSWNQFSMPADRA
ncbi:MAG: hypothetical protein MJ016_00940 [Victivallaceae bacterium]|nr:hypothetical protein [Victivallaceae bacterium]